MRLDETAANRAKRYAGILSPEALASATVEVVGVGAIGRQVALGLAAMGVGCVRLWDHDTVEDVNMGTQGYRPDQIGKPKVEATRDDMLAINPAMMVMAQHEKFDTDAALGPMMACVDCMDARMQCLEAAVGSSQVLIDHRMAAQQWRLCVVDSDRRAARYRDSWFPNEEALEQPCGFQSTYYCAMHCAAAGISLLSRLWQGRDLPETVQSSVLANCVTIDDDGEPTPAPEECGAPAEGRPA